MRCSPALCLVVSTDAIFIVHQLQEKYITANKPLYFALFDLEKAYGHVSRWVLWWALKSLSIEGIGCACHLRHILQCPVSCAGQLPVQWGVWHGSDCASGHLPTALHPWKRFRVIFAPVMPWELLYADHLVLIANTLDEFISKLRAWKAGMESKGLLVHMKKTKFLVLALALMSQSGKYPCVACLTRVSNNSIECSQCKLWVHKRCNVITGCLVAGLNNIWLRCHEKARPIDGRSVA